jgi:hypothetical protein
VRARFRPVRFAAWFAAALFSAAGLAWLAVKVEAVFAPLLLFPALVGLALSALLVVEFRTLAVAHRPSVLAGAVIAAAVLVGCQHYFSFLDARRHAQAQSAQLKVAESAFPEMAERIRAGEDTFYEFIRRSADRGASLLGLAIGATGVWLLWSLNAAITIAVAMIVVAIALRRRFCDSCGSWYQATRAGRIGATTAAELAAILELTSAPTADARYRLWTCRSGCGPTRCELSWSESGAGSRTAWLTDEARRQVVAILDRASAVGGEGSI